MGNQSLPLVKATSLRDILCQMITADKLKATNDEICYRPLILITASRPTRYRAGEVTISAT